MSGFDWADDTQGNEVFVPTLSSELSLPPRQETFDPNSGIRCVIEYSLNRNKERVKTTKQFKTQTQEVRISKSVTRRAGLTQFGDAAGATEADQKNVTYKAYDDIRLNLSASTADDDEDDPLKGLVDKKSLVSCRLCGVVGDHWTLKCPKRGGPATEPQANNSKTAGSSSGAPARGRPGVYVPPGLRQGSHRGPASSSDGRDDMPTVRITNLSEDTTEQDLGELLAPFGRILRIRLAKDRVTNYSKGYAFISFSNRMDAQSAIDKLNGYGYDSLILRVEWSLSMQQVIREREEKEAADAASAGRR